MNITLLHKAARTRRGHGPKLPDARFEDYEQIAGLEARFPEEQRSLGFVFI